MIPRIIIYDFDGVICNSVNVKTEAFVSLYSEFNEQIRAQVKNYHVANGGISRFEKIRYFENILLGKKINEEDIQILGERFANLVKDKVIASEYILGAYGFIENNGKKIDQFICTGTPESEIVEIATARGITSYFKGIYGSPKIKTTIINEIIEKTKVNRDECLFFGDAMTDYHAANECQIPFIGVRSDETNFPDDTILITDFYDLKLKQYGL